MGRGRGGGTERGRGKLRERKRERWLAASIPLQIVLKCICKCRRLQNPYSNSDTLFTSALQDASIQIMRRNGKGESPAILAQNSSDFLFFPLPHSSIHCSCVQWQPPLLLNASVTAGAERRC